MLVVFLTAVAATAVTPEVKVAPAVANPAWVSNGVQLQPAPECLGVTLDTLDVNSKCKIAVEQFQPGAIVPVAIRTIASTTRHADAVSLLEKSTQRSDHPVTHAVLGLMLSSGEHVQPDYPRALLHLQIASDAGNPSAINQLAKLLYEGRGTERDLARATKMSAKAAALGYHRAATDLAQLYHVGLLLPRDETLSREWLNAAIAAGDPTAKKLANTIASEKKVHLLQVLPSPDPAKVRIVDYSPLTQPEVRADFGFDEAFENIFKQPYSDPATLAQLERDARQLPTPYLFELARRLAGTDKDRARKTLLVAQMRMAYDAARCMDSAAAYEAIPAWTQFATRDARYLTLDPPPPNFFNEVLAIEASFPADNQPWWLCRAGNAARLAAAISEADPRITNTLRLIPKAEWPAIREKFRAAVKSDADKTKVQPRSAK